MQPINMNMIDIGDDVDDIKRSNRTIKDLIRCTIHKLLYIWIIHIMVRGLVGNAIKGLNRFPSKYRISDTVSCTARLVSLGIILCSSM